MELLSQEFIDTVIKDDPKPLNEIGEFVFYRTYSRWLPDKGRRETWPETIKRVVEFSMALDIEHRQRLDLPVNIQDATDEAQAMFKAIYTTRVFSSGRTLWIGGATDSTGEELGKEYALANFNCAFTNIEKWEDLCEVFYLLMVGAGVGFKCTPEMAANLAPIRTNTTLLHSEYKPVPKSQRLESTALKVLDNGYAKIYIGDSKEGWIDALRQYFKLITGRAYTHVHTIKISYNSLRPKGERLASFGGTASGHEQIQAMFKGIDRVLKNQIDPTMEPPAPVTYKYDPAQPDAFVAREWEGFARVRPIHILDIGNLIGQNVVSGGVRRTAEMFIFDPDDTECLLAKYGINGFWTDDHLYQHGQVMRILGDAAPAWMDSLRQVIDSTDSRNGGWFFDRDIQHRRLSNNSAAFIKKPAREKLQLMLLLQRLQGDPNFLNLQAAGKRRYNAQGCNPCLTGDTIVAVADGRNGVPIKDLVNKEFPVYSARISSQKIRSAKKSITRDVWITEVKTAKCISKGVKKIISVKLSDGSNILCTPDHMLGIWDGTFVEAKDSYGYRLAKFFSFSDLNSGKAYRTINSFTYGRQYHYMDGYYRITYDDKTQIHHLDEDATNDLLENLSAITPKDHMCQCSEARKQDNPISKDVNFHYNQGLKNIKANAKKYEWSEEHTQRALDKYIAANDYIKTEDKNQYQDHTIFVIAVEDTDKYEQVFDLQVEDNHNFYIITKTCDDRYLNCSGTLVHNCGEILLDSKGVCNLVTQNMAKIAEQSLTLARQDYTRAAQIFRGCAGGAARLAARMAVRMTLITLEMPEWNATQRRDRLIGVSMTGVKDAAGLLDLSEQEEMGVAQWVRDTVHEAARAYAKELRIPEPLLCTTLKPEGTLSQVAGCVSSGNQYQKYPYFIRRIRISADDPLAGAAIDLGWRVNPEVGTPGADYTERMVNADVWVIDFPVHSTSRRFEADVTAEQQLNNYFNYLRIYTDHNPSNTITVAPDEWGVVEERIWNQWDEFIGLTFLAKDGGTYQLMPYEQITADEYHKLRSQMRAFNPDVLTGYEQAAFDSTPDVSSDCATGACPVR